MQNRKAYITNASSIDGTLAVKIVFTCQHPQFQTRQRKADHTVHDISCILEQRRIS